MTKAERKALKAWLNAASLALSGYHDEKARERVWRLVGTLEWFLVDAVALKLATSQFVRGIERELCEHEWTSGACLKCGAGCLHSAFVHDKCTTCGSIRMGSTREAVANGLRVVK